MAAKPIDQLHQHLNDSSFTVAITGAGISIPAGIDVINPRTLRDAETVISTQVLRSTPDAYYAAARRWFLDPVFINGPTLTHRVLARLEEQSRLHGIITTNLDHLHTLAGSRSVAEVQGSFAINTCLDCGRRENDVRLWDQGSAPRCPACGGPLAPYPTSSGIGLLQEDVEKAQWWISRADLAVVIGTTGPYGMAYLNRLNPAAAVVQINPATTLFDQLATLNIREPADAVFGQLDS